MKHAAPCGWLCTASHVAQRAVVLAFVLLVSTRCLASPDAQGRTFVVYFEHASAVVPAEAQAVLDLAVAYQKTVGASAVLLVGHADTLGSRAYNKWLSRARAAAVRSHLVAAGVARGNVALRASGESNPPYRTPDETSQPLNRCVVLEVRVDS